jgi:hypothetical protein
MAERFLPRALTLGALAIAELTVPSSGQATVNVTSPNDGSVFLALHRPPGKFDETGLSGFEFLISSRADQFRANDQCRRGDRGHDLDRE